VAYTILSKINRRKDIKVENNKIMPPIQLEKRIGGITYLVAVNFKSSGETAKDKILRLIKREVSDIA
jgi:hypothetical protein